MQMTGAKIVMECLVEQGVDTVFGYPGGNIINVYDALYDYRDKIRHVLTSHEQGAAHAADGYARVSGKVGVVMATSGPGATNLVTGIATAYMDSVPMVAITCGVSLPMLGKDNFQEVDITGVTMPITKHNFIVKSTQEVATTIRRAFEIAREGRKGPVLVDIPKDITNGVVEFEPYKPPLRAVHKFSRNQSIICASELIEQADRPLIYAGGGVIQSDACEELLQFAHLIDAPVSVSSMALGGYPCDDEYYLGLMGMHGTKLASYAASECDLLIAVGARFSDRAIGAVKSFAKQARVIHIDIDPAEINKTIVVDHSIIGNAKEVLASLCEMTNRCFHPEWSTALETVRNQFPMKMPVTDTANPQEIMEAIWSASDKKTTLVTDVGQHQMWAWQFYPYPRPRSLVSSCGLGTMGFGLGAAIGVQMARPDDAVFLVTGDGCLHMNMAELATAVTERLPLVVVLFDNKVLGMVRQWQSLFFKKRYSQTSIGRETDYVKLVEAFGGIGIKPDLHDKAALPGVMQQALATAREKRLPVLVVCEIDQDLMVMPMVPAGAALGDPILSICEDGSLDRGEPIQIELTRNKSKMEVGAN